MLGFPSRGVSWVASLHLKLFFLCVHFFAASQFNTTSLWHVCAAKWGVAALGNCKDADAVRASGLCCRCTVFIELFGVYLGYALWEFSVAESNMESISHIEGVANNTQRNGRGRGTSTETSSWFVVLWQHLDASLTRHATAIREMNVLLTRFCWHSHNGKNSWYASQYISIDGIANWQIVLHSQDTRLQRCYLIHVSSSC